MSSGRDPECECSPSDAKGTIQCDHFCRLRPYYIHFAYQCKGFRRGTDKCEHTVPKTHPIFEGLQVKYNELFRKCRFEIGNSSMQEKIPSMYSKQWDHDLNRRVYHCSPISDHTASTEHKIVCTRPYKSPPAL